MASKDLNTSKEWPKRGQKLKIKLYFRFTLLDSKMFIQSNYGLWTLEIQIWPQNWQLCVIG